MALEGNVKDFGLSEILQLIALQKKTGMLSITGEQPMVIYFREGQVISTRDRRKVAEDPLRDYLLGYGFLTKEEMGRIGQIQTETNLDLADILISEKKFSDDELHDIFAEQIQESMQNILSCPKSQYKFIIGSQVLQGVKSFGGFKVEGLLMESMRRIDEFPELLRIFPSEETVVKSLPMPAEKSPELDTFEQSVYDLIGGQKSLGEIVPLGRAPRFNTYEALKSLLEKELLQIIEVEKPPAVAAEEETGEKRAPRPASPYPAAVALGALIVCLLAGEFAVPVVSPPGWRIRNRSDAAERAAPDPSVAPTLPALELRLLEATVREGLEEHLALTGAYPASLETLVAEGVLSGKLLTGAHAEGFTYRPARGGRSYSIERNRP